MRERETQEESDRERGRERGAGKEKQMDTARQRETQRGGEKERVQDERGIKSRSERQTVMKCEGGRARGRTEGRESRVSALGLDLRYHVKASNTSILR